MFLKMRRMNQMNKIYKSAVVSVLSALIVFAACVPGARAQTGLSAGNAVKAVLHRSAHELPLFKSPFDSHKMLVVIPEPNSGALIVVGGVIGLIACRLRRPARNTIQNVRQ